MTKTLLTTTIPYVNARPHVGFALELVQADVLARHLRRCGHEVRLQTGTDDNSLKNVLAAEAAGVAVTDFVDGNASAFAELGEVLNLSVDAFVRTSGDERHRTGVQRIWRACAASGDLYRRHYTGFYCVGCEQFYPSAQPCPEHGTVPAEIAEENWFFRLSRYEQPLRSLITSGRLRIEPVARRNEVLALIDSGLLDFSASRSRERARGWGIAVPDDAGQVVYVWFDALGNYVTGGPDWWESAGRRVHLVGKGVLRFHAVYWPAILLSAGLPLPTEIVVHDYLTVDGRKISKSAGGAASPVELVDGYGVDALRWWLLREVPPVGDVDFTVARLVARADEELANGVGNLVNRVVTLVHRLRSGVVPVGSPVPEDAVLRSACDGVGSAVDAALAGYDFRAATAAVWSVVVAANRYVERSRPWELSGVDDRAALDGCLAALVRACRVIAAELAPFLPDLAARASRQLAGEVLPPAVPLVRRLSRSRGGAA
jgi:methionyl-tRNA synthetase